MKKKRRRSEFIYPSLFQVALAETAVQRRGAKHFHLMDAVDLA